MLPKSNNGTPQTIVPQTRQKAENSFSTPGSFGVGTAIGAGYNVALSFVFTLAGAAGAGSATLAGIGTYSATQSPLGSIAAGTATGMAAGGATLYYAGYKLTKKAYNKIKNNDRLDQTATATGIATGFALASAVPYLILSAGMNSLGNAIDNMEFTTEETTSIFEQAPESPEWNDANISKDLDYIVVPE